MLFESREQGSLTLQYFQLEVFNGLSFFCGTYLAEERFVTTIFYAIAKRTYVWNADVYIIWIESTIEHGGLSAFTYTRGNPFARIDFFECLENSMEVVCAAFSSQVLPVARLWGGFQEVAIFHEYHIGVEHSGKFFAVSWREGVACSVTFGYDNGWTVEAYMRDDDTLAEVAKFRTVVVERLGKVGYVFLCKFLTFKRLDFCNLTDGFQFVLKNCLGGCCEWQ